jgi:hypothetical protein
MIVSDGSCNKSLAAGGWIITSSSLFPNNFATGSLPTPGPVSELDSHQAELIAILGALCHLRLLLKKWRLCTGIIHYGCDNLSAIHYAFNIEQYFL